MTRKNSYKLAMTMLCVMLAVSLFPGVTLAETEADLAVEKDNIVGFQALSEMQTLPVDFTTVDEDGKKVVVHVNPIILAEVDGDMVAELIESSDLNAGDRININNIGYCERRYAPMPAVDFDNYYNTTYIYDVVRETHNKFVISVAKGSTKTLESTWTYTISGGFEGTVSLYDVASVTAKLAGAVTCTYKTTYIFKGPPESSKYNSREYRVKYYKQRVKVTQTDPVTSFERTSTYDKAVKYADYSIDSKIG